MRNLAGSKTENNLKMALRGEALGAAMYRYHAEKARNEGFQDVADIFDETAGNEQEHGKMWYKLLHNGLGNTKENLSDAVSGEHEEHTSMYPGFEREARQEGFDEIADLFRAVGSIEQQHEMRFQRLLDRLEQNQMFHKDQPVKWKCLNCGYTHTGTDAPKHCPACAHPQGFFAMEEC